VLVLHSLYDTIHRRSAHCAQCTTDTHHYEYIYIQLSIFTQQLVRDYALCTDIYILIYCGIIILLLLHIRRHYNMALRDEIHNVIHATPGLPPLHLHTPVMDVPAIIKHGAVFSRQAGREKGARLAEELSMPQTTAEWQPEPDGQQKELLMKSEAWRDGDAALLCALANRMRILWEETDASKFMAAVAMRERAQTEMGKRSYGVMHAELRLPVIVPAAAAAVSAPALPAPAGATPKPPPPPAILRPSGGAGPGLLSAAPPCNAGAPLPLVVPAPDRQVQLAERMRPQKYGAGPRKTGISEADAAKLAAEAARKQAARKLAREQRVRAEEASRQQQEAELQQLAEQRRIRDDI